MEQKHARLAVGDGDASGNKGIDKTDVPAVVPPSEGENDEQLIEGEDFWPEGEEEMGEEEQLPPPPPIPLEEFFENRDAGGIDLAFTEHLEYADAKDCYPRSYYTLTGKERLLLLYAENFRKQFNSLYSARRPLLLAPKNECQVQKFVCTTIRPTAFLFPPLIASAEGCAAFVADFIEYGPLESPFSLATRLVSPATLLRERRGNSFEMATLLCSMLIGAGFPAMVVSGSAKIQTTTNDQRHVDFPLPEIEPIQDDTEDDVKFDITDTRYVLKPKPELTSHLEERMEKLRIETEAREKTEQDETLRKAREALEDENAFKDPLRRSHAWVAIVNNAPWSTKPRPKLYDEDGEEIEVPPSVSFIEPTTGFVHETSTRAYVHIESIWNNLNYYVNLQPCRINELKWDLRDTSNWEHFLAAEPPEMRISEELSDENLGEETNQIAVEKHLDMGRSWVDKLYISEKEFDQQFPNKCKAIYYRRVLHERFASHSEADGKKEQITSYLDDEYQEPAMRWTWFDNRSDLLIKLRHDFASGDTEESFLKGRTDALKYYLHNDDKKRPVMLYFYSEPRLDSLKYAQVTARNLILKFEKSPGKCFYKEFTTKAVMAAHRARLREITEKFHRDPEKPAGKDIATRRFLIASNKIQIKFHYARGALTAENREFIKPPKPDYGCEIIFNPELTTGQKYRSSEPDSTQLELYLLLLDSLKAEDAAMKAYYKHREELHGIIEQRNEEMEKIILKFKAFDPLRNAAARKIRMEMDAKEEEEKKKRRENLPDFLAPYLVPYAGRALTVQESWAAYNACLNDMKTRFVSLLNELQRRYEDLTAEALSLKKFLNKFQNKFEDFDYERLLNESKELELHKRMVQKRLTITHEEAQKKYDLVKQSLLKDPRLNLRKSVVAYEDTDSI